MGSDCTGCGGVHRAVLRHCAGAEEARRARGASEGDAFGCPSGAGSHPAQACGADGEANPPAAEAAALTERRFCSTDDGEPMQMGMVVRVMLPVTDVSLTGGPQEVAADLAIGEDGRPRAFRLVR